MYANYAINNETTGTINAAPFLTSNAVRRIMADGIVRQKYGRWKPVPKEIEDQVIAFYLEGNSALQCSK